MTDTKKPAAAGAAAAAEAAARTPTPFETHAEALHAAIMSAAPGKEASDPKELTYKAAAEYASKVCHRTRR